MAVKVERADIWVASLDDRPGALAAKLAALSEAGANLRFALARRSPERPCTALVEDPAGERRSICFFVSPLARSREDSVSERRSVRQCLILSSDCDVFFGYLKE